MMKRFLFKILIITLSFVSINLIFLLLLGIFNIEFKKTREISSFENKSFNCIVTGNSLSLDGFDTYYLNQKGISSYNFALGGSSFLTNIIQLEKYLEKNQPPKVLILGLGSQFISRNLDQGTVHPIVEYFYLDNKFNIENLPVVRFKWLAAEMFKLLFSSDHRNAESKYGQYRSDRSVPDKTVFKQSIEKFDVTAFVGSSDFKRLEVLLKNHKIDLMVFQMPLYRSSRNTLNSVQEVRIDSTFSFPLINMNNHEVCEKLFNPEKDWLGNSHLNKNGAQKFTEYIYDVYLKKVFL